MSKHPNIVYKITRHITEESIKKEMKFSVVQTKPTEIASEKNRKRFKVGTLHPHCPHVPGIVYEIRIKKDFRKLNDEIRKWAACLTCNPYPDEIIDNRKAPGA